MATLRVGPLPGAALAAAAQFHASVLPGVRNILDLLRDSKPLTFRGGVGGGVCPQTQHLIDTPHPNPSPEGEGLDAHLTLIFPPADHTHRGWRLAAVQGLAREYAPLRINAVESDDDAAIAAAVDYLAGANGFTGQLLPLDSHGAGKVIASPA